MGIQAGLKNKWGSGRKAGYEFPCVKNFIKQDIGQRDRSPRRFQGAACCIDKRAIFDFASKIAAFNAWHQFRDKVYRHDVGIVGIGKSRVSAASKKVKWGRHKVVEEIANERPRDDEHFVFNDDRLSDIDRS